MKFTTIDGKRVFIVMGIVIKANSFKEAVRKVWEV